jgi:hypothetical protein
MACAVWVIFGASSAYAATVFRMGDGRYYDPSTGRIAATAEELQISSASTTVIVSGSAASVATSSQNIVSVPLKDAIERGRALLQEAIQRDATSTPKIANSDTTWRPVKLALWNRNTDNIQTVQIQKNGQEVRQDPDDPNVDVTVSNGLNSTFRLDDPEAVVVAIRYPILKDISTKKKKQFQVQDVVYTPYSAGLHTPEMVQIGKQRLNEYIDGAYASLDTQQIRSRTYSDRLLTGIIDRDTAKAVAVIEHADNTALRNHPTQTIERFFVTLAANEKDSYAYAKSSAGALGLVQFMPKSYAAFIKSRPELGLTFAFEPAMRDPHNALKAEVAYLDYQLASLSAKDRETILGEDMEWREFAVAAYNGGPSRVSKAIQNWDAMFGAADALPGLQAKSTSLTADIARMRKLILAEEDETIWKPMQKKLNQARKDLSQIQSKVTQLKNARLRAETIDYVQKYRKVMEWLKTDGISIS